MSDMWSTVAAERGALADDLEGLSADRWDTESLCRGWTVRDVLAHMSATAAMTPPAFFAGMAKARFNFDRFADVNVARNRGADPEETLAIFRGRQHSTTAPPGPKTTWLGETIVHAEDIRRPLGIEHDYDLDALRQVADFYKGSNLLIGAKKRIDGLQLIARDTSWTHGSGKPVEGPMVSLVVAMTGRAGACRDLTGDGVPTLESRCR